MREPGDLVPLQGQVLQVATALQALPRRLEAAREAGLRASATSKLRYVVIDVVPKRAVKSARH